MYLGIHTGLKHLIAVVYDQTQCSGSLFRVKFGIKQCLFCFERTWNTLDPDRKVLKFVKIFQFVLEEFHFKPYLFKIDDLKKHLLFFEA